MRDSHNNGIRSFLSERWTDPLRERAAQNHSGIYPAAFLLRDAMEGESLGMTEEVFNRKDYFDPYSNTNHQLLNFMSRICRWLLTQRISFYLENAAVWALLLLSAVEPPFWCRDYEQVEVEKLNGFGECNVLLSMKETRAFGGEGEDYLEYYPNMHTNFLSVHQSFSVEWVCIAIIMTMTVARMGADGFSMRRYFFIVKDEGPVATASYQEAQILRATRISSALILAMTNKWTDNSVSLVLFLRVLIWFTYSKATQRELATVVKIAPELVSILFLLFVIIFFYALVGVVMFSGKREGIEAFSNITEAMWTLWTCVTTANYPDAMMPAYNESRLVCIYFISFMVFTFFFLMNVILASVVNGYNNTANAKKEASRMLRRGNLTDAFKLLDDENTGIINRQTLMLVFRVLNEDCPEVRFIPDAEAEILFAILDRDGTEDISEDEFMSFCEVMLLQFEQAAAYLTFVERHFPDFFNSRYYQSLSGMIKSDRFESAVDIAVLVNAVFVAIQSYPELIGNVTSEKAHIREGYIDTVWEGFQTLFTVLYCFEMFLKIVIFSWKQYWESFRNRFDAAITILSLSCTIFVYYPNHFSDARLIRFVVMARVLRLVRVLVAMKQFQVIGQTFLDIIPAARRILSFLIAIVYIFSVIGMQLFGGMVTRDPSNPISARLEGTTFADSEYWANNFNDMLSSFNVLFNLLVVNNWTTMSNAMVVVCDSKMVRYYFIAFHILGVIVVGNLVVAFIIDSFLNEWQEIAGDSSQIDTGDAVITKTKRAIFDAHIITGTETNLTGLYMARLADHGAAERQSIMQHQRGELQRLFTKTGSYDGSGFEN